MCIRRKILVVLDSFKNFGGAANMAVNLASALREFFEFVFCARSGRFAEKINGLGFECVELPDRVPLHVLPYLILRVSRLQNVSILHAHTSFLAGSTGLLLKLFSPRIRVLVTSHVTQFTRGPRWMSTFLLNNFTDRVFAVAEHGRQKLIKQGIHPYNIETIHNFVDVQRFSPSGHKDIQIGTTLTAIMTGRLVSTKKFDNFIRIINVLNKQRFNIKGIIVGEGPEMNNLRRLAYELKAEEIIEFVGYTNLVERELRRADLFLFPSQHDEILPVALLEASACGLPIVASNIDGNREVVTDSETGFLIDQTEDILTYARRVKEILSDRVKFQAFSRAARHKIVEQFSFNRIAPKYICHYSELQKNPSR